MATDGQRFECSTSFGHSTPSLGRLAHAKACRRLAPIKIAPAQLEVVARVEKARSCLRGEGLRPIGGAMFLTESTNPVGPHGELIVRDAYLAFYTNTTQARLGAQGIAANPTTRIGGKVERHGTVAILLIHPPSAAERSAISACLPS
jgi:hypothetical protein